LEHLRQEIQALEKTRKAMTIEVRIIFLCAVAACAAFGALMWVIANGG
jgi:hypothetical protein